MAEGANAAGPVGRQAHLAAPAIALPIAPPLERFSAAHGAGEPAFRRTAIHFAGDPWRDCATHSELHVTESKSFRFDHLYDHSIEFEGRGFQLSAGSRVSNADVVSRSPRASAAPMQCGLQVTTYRDRRIWRNQNVIVFIAGMSIDADGSPHAYHPDDLGLDDLSHAGTPGHWAGLATVKGVPVIQGSEDPAPSFFVSATALEDDAYPVTSPAHYVDAETIPYIALPSDLGGPHWGDLAYVLNPVNGHASAAIVADESPRPGEGSIALAEALGINPDARYGGKPDGVVFVVFLHSGLHPLPGFVIDTRVRRLREDLGVDDLLNCIGEIAHERGEQYSGL